MTRVTAPAVIVASAAGDLGRWVTDVAYYFLLLDSDASTTLGLYGGAPERRRRVSVYVSSWLWRSLRSRPVRHTPR